AKSVQKMLCCSEFSPQREPSGAPRLDHLFACVIEASIPVVRAVKPCCQTGPFVNFHCVPARCLKQIPKRPATSFVSRVVELHDGGFIARGLIGFPDQADEFCIRPIPWPASPEFFNLGSGIFQRGLLGHRPKEHSFELTRRAPPW